MAKRKNQDKWFTPVRGSYLPKSWEGLILYFIFVAYLVMAVVVTIRNSGSATYVSMQILAQWIIATIVITWIAQRKS